jgi:hypothetical protein
MAMGYPAAAGVLNPTSSGVGSHQFAVGSRSLRFAPFIFQLAVISIFCHFCVGRNPGVGDFFAVFLI